MPLWQETLGNALGLLPSIRFVRPTLDTERKYPLDRNLLLTLPANDELAELLKKDGKLQ